MFKHLKVGDIATRDLCGIVEDWKVTEVTDTLVIIGMGWSFDRETGVEEDPYLGWGVAFGKTGSRLTLRR